ncbi:RNase adapter RapZ [Acidihalobacter ferrooxydans]|uniref:RNase adaptor protein RapZ n=1 Tax=Acidihalobacter ferrooxydans TaxID=1765967 RepID=A0A1P8UJB7_9GAMM|nr:RNase adapter RapZ [Acidihalobacter ferrooxydans]APZ43939.1 RNase adaptor protein RapZ [Acidihalobacter ferrooxydans]
MRLVIVSGLSGSGKTVALHALEDEGFYCIDNLHLGLLTAFVAQLLTPKLKLYEDAAVGIDARSGVEELRRFSAIVEDIRAQGIDLEVVYLQAEVETLLKRFSETRRKHPLSRKGLPLIEAIHLERTLLSEIAAHADLVIDTTRSNVHQLIAQVRERVGHGPQGALGLQFQSFGFKHGVPTDSDYVFDVRCLPNPHWEPRLRSQTGLDPAVREYLEAHPMVEQMYDDLRRFLENWIPRFEAENRNYLSVSIGCTGGQHRSVYLVQRLGEHFRTERSAALSIRHRELE